MLQLWSGCWSSHSEQTVYTVGANNLQVPLCSSMHVLLMRAMPSWLSQKFGRQQPGLPHSSPLRRLKLCCHLLSLPSRL